jgi:hypothetical protein
MIWPDDGQYRPKHVARINNNNRTYDLMY